MDVTRHGKTMKTMLRWLEFLLRKRNGEGAASPEPGGNNYYAPAQFRKRLIIEKRRAERLNAIASLIVLRAKNGLQQKRDAGTSSLKSLERLAHSISPALRETDAISVYKKNLILVLLPDTDNGAAQCALKRLEQYAQKSAAAGTGFEDFEIQILSYPEQPLRRDAARQKPGASGNGHHEAGPSALHLNGGYGEPHPEKSYLETFNLCLSGFNGASLAAPFVDAFLWELPARHLFGKAVENALKRIIDIAGATAMLIVFAPVMLMVAILIKCTSSGPVLFRQKRLGLHGRVFTFLKFRSMHHNSEDRLHQDFMKKLIGGDTANINHGTNADPFYKMKNDPRITPIGRFIRRTSIDELPQLLNVLKGDMSLIGPRPPIPYEAREYKIWHHRRLMQVKPGITGLWQVSGRSRTTFSEMVRLDIHYARNWSLMMDFKILFKTVRSVLASDGV